MNEYFGYSAVESNKQSLESERRVKKISELVLRTDCMNLSQY